MGKEFTLTDRAFQRIVQYAKNYYGIDLSQKRVIVEGRLKNYLSTNGYKSYEEYMDVVEQDRDGKEAKGLVNMLTTNHTFFMREFEHFEYFHKVVLPQLKEKEKSKKDLHIWCAAASSGEEPYTIAMVLMDYFGMEHNQWDTTVLATDISTKVLEKALKGVYNNEQLVNLPANWRKRYFQPVNQEQSIVTDHLKKQVLFRQFNLMDPLPFRKKLHVVFIRNVMIYFEEDTKHQLLNRIYDIMEPGGYLFIGTTETIDRDKTRFQYIKPSIYKK
ncbi:MAG: protein-glutamate O-methyltransferase CheR [Lachnospiraceae bacterium]|nr:protein-glutamate O-methyltransferase CheR [Lachnospiraceae bacterium]